MQSRSPCKMSNWKSKMSANEAFLTLFDKQENCDVMFCIGSKNIGAHKAFLQARSEVLTELIKDWTLKEEPLVIDDLSFDTFRAVLRYIYTDAVDISDNNVFQFLFAAKSLKMGHLEACCTNHITDSLCMENVCSFVEQAIEFNAVALQQKCCNIFSKETNQILASDEFLSLSQPTISALLDADEINVLEIDLFLAVKRWMVQQCKNQGLPENGTNMRCVIGDALYKIRFPTMTMLDYSNEVTTIDGLLSDAEMLQIYRKISVLDNENIQCPFSAKFRSVDGALKDNISSCLNVLTSSNVCQNGGLSNINKAFRCWHDSTANKNDLSLRSAQLVLQCSADLLNTTTSRSKVSAQFDQTLKKECCDKLKKLDTAVSSNNRNIREVLSKFIELRETLAKLPFVREPVVPCPVHVLPDNAYIDSDDYDVFDW